VGSNNRETRFRIIEIDRRADNELKIHENPNEIDGKEIKRFLAGLMYTRAICAYGILGFVRFLECYYLILVTKRTRCAVVGMHIIYTVKDTAIIRISETNAKQPHPYEQRYLKMFTNIDLNSNFYFR
jgi:phosphatidylinositol 3,5-bisphosphate 5-phosphatase